MTSILIRDVQRDREKGHVTMETETGEARVLRSWNRQEGPSLESQEGA